MTTRTEDDEKRPNSKPRGFATMTPEQRSEISSKGGRAAHRAGTAHQFTPEEARKAGRKGAAATHKRRRERRGYESA
jgi:general stress protein YciG